MNEQTTVLEVIEQAANELDENNSVELSKRYHERSTETTSVRAILKRMKEGRIQLPLCQRLYVWDAKRRECLFDTIERNWSCGTVILAESETDGVQYLTDGLQRLTSCIYLSVDQDRFGLTVEQKKAVLDYNITLSIVKGMTDQEIKMYFDRLNSGVALAAVVKERSKLSDELNNAILSISSNEFFRESKTTAIFTKAHHHELIAMNLLLAAAGVPQGENKAKALCSKLSENSESVLENAEEAQKILQKIISVYSGLDEDVIKRSLNANFISSLVYVLHSKDHSGNQVKDLINHIFEGKRAISDYTATTSNGAADEKKCKARYDLLVALLENPPMKNFDETDYKTWQKGLEGVLKTSKGDIVVDIKEVPESDLKGVYVALRDGKRSVANSIITRTYERLDNAN